MPVILVSLVGSLGIEAIGVAGVWGRSAGAGRLGPVGWGLN